MKSFPQFISKYLEIGIIFVVLSALNLDNLLVTCKIYDNLGFDFQALLTWDYSASLGIVPYKEIFYPYGILAYFKNQSILSHVLFFFITPVLLTSLFIVFKKIWGGRLYACLFLLLLFLFVTRIIGHDGLDRYGIFVTFSLVLGFILYTRKSLTKNTSFIFGVITGIILWLMNDQGIYVFIVFTVNLFLYPIVLGKQLAERKSKYYKPAFLKFVIYLVGITVGTIPLFLYLFKNGAILDFSIFFIRFSDLSLYAKTPFPPYSNTPENIFTFAILIPAIFYLAFRLIFKEKITLNNYLQINLCFIIIFLEQKSLIRSIDSVITFPSLILLILLVADIIEKQRLNKKYIYLFLIFTVAMSLFVFKNSKNISKIYFINSNECINRNLNSLLKDNSEYLVVKNIVSDKFGYKGKIFSYPSDPIFYLLFKQIPPYYSNNYDSSPIYAQKKQIDYIKNNNVKYIIYNLETPSVMDNVPNYIRTSDEFNYILNNFKIKDKVGNFLIFEKNKNSDIFADNNLYQYGHFKKYLTEINLESIPRSEGKYKKKILQSDRVRVIGEFKSIAGLNNFLKENVIFSKNKFMVFIPEESDKSDMTIDISSIKRLKTSVRFRSCDKFEFCIINLSKIPLFYNNRILKKIIINSEFGGDIELIEIKNPSFIW